MGGMGFSAFEAVLRSQTCIIDLQRPKLDAYRSLSVTHADCQDDIIYHNK